MNQSTDAPHVRSLLADYSIGLLAAKEREWVIAHLSACGECRRALSVEQNVARSVRETLTFVSSPDPERIRRLMPASPAAGRPRGRTLLVSPGIATATVMLLVLFGAIALFSIQRPGSRTLSNPTIDSTTIFHTSTPTTTATREVTATAARPVGLSDSRETEPHPTGDRLLAPVPAPVPSLFDKQ